MGFFCVTTFFGGNCHIYNLKKSQNTNIMKQKVIEFLQNVPKDKSLAFNGAFELYRKSPNKNPSFERAMNRSGYSKENLQQLLFELQKANDIKAVELHKPVNKVLEVLKDDVATGDDAGTGDDTAVDVVVEPSADFNKPIREEFPFLNEPNCPDEFKILVADKITAWNAYKLNHALLQKHESGEAVLSEEEAACVAKESVEMFELNQSIYEELNHYQANGEILGKHPIFKDYSLKLELAGKTKDELLSIIKNAPPYISKAKKSLDKEKDLDKRKVIEKRIQEREYLVLLATEILGVSGQ